MLEALVRDKENQINENAAQAEQLKQIVPQNHQRDQMH